MHETPIHNHGRRWTARFLMLNGVAFALFGLGFVFAPAFFSGLFTGAVPATPDALTDMRATCGGVALGLGILFTRHAMDASRLRSGLLAVLYVTLPLAGARLYGMFAAGAANGFMIAFLGTEVVVILLAIALLRNLDDAEHPT